MIFPFPYSNLYNLNLDWMIKTMKEMQEIVEPLSRVVNSVNGMTGDVQITKQFLLQILESMVSKFNGRAGDVTLTAADVNSTMIDITWTSDPGDVIEDIAQNVRDQLYAIGKRVLIFVNNQGVPDQIYFLTLVGDVVTPQIYSPTAALAGVASFNGQTGAVTATGSDLDTANDDDTPISESIGDLQTAVSEQSQQIDNIKAMTAYIETGTTASRAYTLGQYFIIDNTLYKVIAPIASGAAFTDNNRVAVTNGGLNSILDRENITATPSANITIQRFNAFVQNEIGIINFLMDVNSNVSLYDVLFTINYTAQTVTIMNLFNGYDYSPISVPAYIDGDKIRVGGSIASGTRITGSCVFFIKTN